MTEFGFVRVSSNPAAVGDALSPAEALTVLDEIRGRPGHEDWADDVSPTDRRWVDPTRLVGHRQVGDAHLLALARRHQGRLATLDQGLADLAGADATTRITVIPLDLGTGRVTLGAVPRNLRSFRTDGCPKRAQVRRAGRPAPGFRPTAPAGG